jgi:hypothetical protein
VSGSANLSKEMTVHLRSFFYGRYKMDEQLYVLAINEAKRFLALAEKLENEVSLRGECHPGIPGNFPPCKQTGALRRASMDLTRALAELRRGR